MTIRIDQTSTFEFELDNGKVTGHFTFKGKPTAPFKLEFESDDKAIDFFKRQARFLR